MTVTSSNRVSFPRRISKRRTPQAATELNSAPPTSNPSVSSLPSPRQKIVTFWEETSVIRAASQGFSISLGLSGRTHRSSPTRSTASLSSATPCGWKAGRVMTLKAGQSFSMPTAPDSSSRATKGWKTGPNLAHFLHTRGKIRSRPTENKRDNGGQVCKPDSVLRVSLTATRRDDHSSGPRIAARLMQPTRGSSPASCEAGCGPDQPSPPIWPCTARGLPCLERRRPSGGLLPHLFTLTVRVPTYSNVPWFRHEPSTVRDAPAVYSLWHFPWPLP